MNAAPDQPRSAMFTAIEGHGEQHALMMRSAAAIIDMCATQIRAGVPQHRQEMLTRAMREIRRRRDAVSPRDDISASLLHQQLQQMILVLGPEGVPPIAMVQTDDQQT